MGVDDFLGYDRVVQKFVDPSCSVSYPLVILEQVLLIVSWVDFALFSQCCRQALLFIFREAEPNIVLHLTAPDKLINCSVNKTESTAILPLGPHGRHMQDYFSSFPPCRVSPNCLNYRRLSISTAVDLSPRVRGSTASGPDHLRKLLRRELENPSTRRAPKLEEDYCLPSSLFSKPPRWLLSVLVTDLGCWTCYYHCYCYSLFGYHVYVVTRPPLGRADGHRHYRRTRFGACPQVDWRDSKADGIRLFVFDASHDLLGKATQLVDWRTRHYWSYIKLLPLIQLCSSQRTTPGPAVLIVCLGLRISRVIGRI